MKFQLAISNLKLGDAKVEKVEFNGEYSAEEVIALLNGYAAALPSIINAMKEG